MSANRIDSVVNRLTIFISVVFVCVSFLTNEPLYLFIATGDYFIRAFLNPLLSPLRFVALYISRLLKLKPRMIDMAPKVFASRLGFLCLFASSVLVSVGMSTASMSIAAMACTLFVLDALGIICVGCVIYHNVVYPIAYGSKSGN